MADGFEFPVPRERAVLIHRACDRKATMIVWDFPDPVFSDSEGFPLLGIAINDTRILGLCISYDDYIPPPKEN